MSRPRALLIGLLVISCAGPGPLPSQQAAQPIIGGAQSASHPSTIGLVVAVHGQTDAFCTGTLIAKRYVLTAAHCIVLSDIPVGYMKAFFGTDVYRGDGPMVQIKRATPHPDFNQNTMDNDVAVLELAQDAPVAPVPMAPRALGRQDIGQVLTLVGFGVNNAAQQSGAGVKRLITLPLGRLDSTHLYYSDRVKGTCQGDSGGSSYLTFDGVEAVVGITDFGSEDCVSMGADTRVDSARDWILQQLPADTDGPIINVQNPQNSDRVQRDFSVVGEAVDDAGIIDVTLLEDGVVLGRSMGATFELPASLGPGGHQLILRATDLRWNHSEQTLDVFVECSSNEECGSGQLCGQGACFAPASVGGECRGNSDCAEGRCIAGTDGVSVCSRACQQDAQCPRGYSCASGACSRRLAVAPGAVGAPCAADDQCQTGMCVDSAAGRGFCTAACDATNPCPNNAVCGAAPASATYCGPPTLATAPGGCATGGDGASGFAAALVLALLMIAARRRTARSVAARSGAARRAAPGRRA